MAFIWDFGDGDSSTSVNPTHIYTTEGVYTVSLTVTDLNGCDSTNVKTDYITVTDPVADFVADSTFSPCPPLLVNFTDSSTTDAVSWRWDFGDGTSSNVRNPSHVYLSPGLFDVMLTVTNNLGCVDTIVKDGFVLLMGPNGTFEFTPQEECLNNEIFFEATTTNTVSRTWDFGDGTLSSGEDTITHVYAISGVYYPSIILQDGMGCTYFVHSEDSLVVGDLDLDFQAGTTDPCLYEAVEFTDLSSGFPAITSRRWFFGDGDSAMVQNPVHSYLSAGAMDVKLIVSNGLCTDTLIKPGYVYADPGPQADFTVSESAGCDSLYVDFQDNTISDSAIVSWYWDFDDGNFDFTANPGNAFSTIRDYDVQFIVTTSNNCRDTIYQTITIHPLPVAEAGPDTSFCEGGSILLNGSGGISYSWIPATSLDDADIAAPVATPASTTKYFLTVTDSNNCQHMDSVTIGINPLPVVSMAGDDSICIGNSIMLWAAGGNDGSDTYIWSPATALDCATCSNPVSQPDSTITYEVEVSTSFQCKGYDTVTVTVVERPGGVITSDSSICFGESMNLEVSEGASYAWTPDSSLSCPDCKEPVATPTSATTYGVTVINDFGCDTYDSVTVTVNPLPDIETEYNDHICQGDNTQIATSGGTIYGWTPSVGLSCDNCSNPVAGPDTTTTYVLEVVNIFACVAYDTLQIQVEPRAIVQTIDDLTLCHGDEIELTTTYENTDSLSWSPSTGLNKSNDPTPIARPDITTQYVITAFNAAKCPVRDTVIISVIDKVEAAISDDFEICIGETVEMEAAVIQEGNMGSNIIWYPVNGLKNPTEWNQTVTPNSDIEYNFIVYSGSCVPDTQSVSITVNPLPVINTGEDQYVIEQTEVTLTTNGSSNISDYEWYPIEDLSCINCANPMVLANNTTTYYVNVVDENGCMNNDSILVKVIGQCGEHVFVPNTFTPNGDDINDELYVRSRSLSSLNYFRIFDRWGTLIFETDDLNTGWNGIYKGKKLNTSVFVYMLQGVCTNGQIVNKKGNVTLMR